METFLHIDLNIYAFIICVGMFVLNLRLPGKSMLQNRFFRFLIMTTMILLLADAAGWAVDGHPGMIARILNGFADMLGYVVSPLPATIWTFYASYQLFHDVHRLKTEVRLFAIPVLINAALSISSLENGLFFTIDSANYYHRGPLFVLLALFSLMPIVYTTVIYIVFRKRMPGSLFYPIVLFSVPTLAGAVIQLLFYGTAITWSAMTVSIFIVHTGLQNRQFYLDHLTGVYNRRQLDNRLQDLLQAGRRQTDFACIMLDIDNFKSINDMFGHVTGDEALKNAASILKSCVRSSDFVARYAGDEFVILLDTGDEKAVCQTICRIQDKATRFNSEGRRPYNLAFSLGYEICLRGSCFTKEMLIAHVDSLMYQDKNNKRSASACSVLLRDKPAHAAG